MKDFNECILNLITNTFHNISPDDRKTIYGAQQRVASGILPALTLEANTATNDSVCSTSGRNLDDVTTYIQHTAIESIAAKERSTSAYSVH